MQKPHAVCIPVPFQSHIKAMLKLAKLLHHRGFHITFVNTEFNYRRFLNSQGPNSLDGLPHFRFETIPDGLPDSDEDCSQEVTLLAECVTERKFLPPFRDLLVRLNGGTGSSNPPVSCIVSDGFMSPSIMPVAEEFELPIALFYTIAACSLMGFKHYRTLVEKGFAPLKDESCLTNGYLDKAIDWIPGMKSIRLRDLPTWFRTTNPDDTLFNLSMLSTDGVHKASAIVVLTFDALEQSVLTALSSMHNIAPLYSIGPIELLLKSHLPKDPLDNVVSYSLWKEETECLQWLDSKPPNSVLYVNFGSIIVMTPEQLVEFSWGLANSKVSFFWVLRPDLVRGKSAILPPEFVAEMKERGLISSWCPQEQVLNHPSVGGFLTHCGWNSTIESLSSGVPMLCWPFIADQQTDCFYACHEWGIGMEIDNDVRRDEVEKVIKELMEGEKGKKMRNKALEWKKLAEDATAPFGSSSINFDNLVNQLRKP